MTYKAIHIATDDGLFVSSTNVDSRDPEKVADQLAKEFGGYPDRIVLLKSEQPNKAFIKVSPTNSHNDEVAPSVIEDWKFGEDYQKEKT